MEPFKTGLENGVTTFIQLWFSPYAVGNIPILFCSWKKIMGERERWISNQQEKKKSSEKEYNKCKEEEKWLQNGNKEKKKTTTELMTWEESVSGGRHKWNQGCKQVVW